MDSIVGEVTVGEDASVATWPMRHIPTINFVTIIVDKANSSRAREMAIKHITW